MTEDEVKKCFRKIVKYGCIRPSKHCRERMLERQINMDDILYVLLWGIVTDIEYSKDHNSWQCKVQGTKTLMVNPWFSPLASMKTVRP